MENQEEPNQIQEFLSKDKISPVKLCANLEIMKNETLEIYRATIKLRSEPDLSKDITPSIEWMAKIYNQPLGYPVWFMTAYPDVVLWASKLKDEKLKSILGNTEDVINKKEKIKISFLRKFVNAYKGEGNVLETV